MDRLRIFSSVVVAAALLVADSPGLAATSGHLVATVRPACAIFAQGVRETRLRRMTYTITVHDVSSTRYFHLSGPGVRRETTSQFVGTVSWRVKLVRGTYAFRCGVGQRLHGTVVVS